MMDEILKKLGLTFEDLTIAERDTLFSWIDSLDNNQLTVEKIKSYVTAMRESVEQELANIKETPQTELSLLCFVIPLIGIIRKWYQDQHVLYLRARLRNVVLLDALLSSPEKARAALENAITNISTNRKG